MTSIERVKNAINLRKVDKLPLNFELLGETDIKILSIKPSKNWKPKKYKPWYLDSDNLRQISEGDKNTKREDEWGTIWGYGNVVGRIGEPIDYPIKDLKEVKRYNFPDPEAPGRFEGFIQEINKNKDKYINVVIPHLLFERLHFLIGFNETMIGIMANPKEIEGLLDRIVEYDIRIIKCLYNNLKDRVHGIISTDDWGTQTALFISPEMWRKFFKPRYKIILEEMHACNFDFWLHSDGKIEEIIPDFIEIGVDVFKLPQPSSVLGIKEFGKSFADKACHSLYIDLQNIGRYTEEEIIKEAYNLVKYWSNKYGSGIIAEETPDPVTIGVEIWKIKTSLEAFKKAFEKKIQKYKVGKLS